jgi:hypothetical protein
MNSSILQLIFGVLVTITLAGCHLPSAREAESEAAKIKFSMEGIRPDGLHGPPDGLRSLTYEFCVPADEQVYQEVRRIDASVQISPGSAGRIGCSKSQALCTGNTHQPGWRAVLQKLSSLSYIAEIRECFFE